MSKKKLLVGGALIGASYLTFVNNEINKLFMRSKVGVDVLSYIKNDKIREKAIADQAMYRQWLLESNKEELYINSYDGLKLHGYLLNNIDTNKYIVIAHGLKESLDSSLSIAYNFEKLGYNSLIYDQRACGESEGEYSTMGLKESFDLIKWINILIESKPNVSICLHGVCMGAVSICMALSTKLPDNVKCIVSDCAYSSLEDEIKHLILRKYHFNLSFLVKTIDAILKKKLNMSLDSVRPIDSLKNNTLPICFVHGDDDKVVPFTMCLDLYNANTNGVRKYYPVKDLGHGQSKFNEDYYNVLNSFIKEYI